MARQILVDLTPLRVSPKFARLWVGNAIGGIGAQMTIVAVGLQIFDMTGDTFMVGLVGGVALVPMIIAGLWGGMLVDAFDRKAVLMTSAITGWVSVLGLVALSFHDQALIDAGDRAEVWPFYVLTTINSVAATISGTARSAIVPRVLPPELVPRASALNGMAFGTMLTVGPALAGVIAGTIGLPWAFLVDAILFSAAFMGIVGLPKLRPIDTVSRPGWTSLVEGLRFLRFAPNIRTSFIVDIIAMSFGRPYALLPAVGAVVIGGAEITVGLLTAAGAIGTLLASLLSGYVKSVRMHGVAIRRAIMFYGGFVGMFGAVILVTQWLGATSTSSTLTGVNWIAFALAAVAMAGMGASDDVSAIFRSSMMLVATPDSMRGRMQGVFTVVVTGGPRVGDIYVGILAAWLGLWSPMLLGGILIVGLVAVIARNGSSISRYDVDHPLP
ncbi:MFS transporter [Agrococcus casei]|uniref:MFS transporter n=1 Tax=Agrococcus casei TaxID=343512 RepID=UPI003F91BEFA